MRYRSGTPVCPLYYILHRFRSCADKADDTVSFDADSGHERRPGIIASKQEVVSSVMVASSQQSVPVGYDDTMTDNAAGVSKP